MALVFVQPAAAKEAADFRCEVRLSEHNGDILKYWEALSNLLHNSAYLSTCISDSDVTVNKTTYGYKFIIQKPSFIFYKAQGLEDKKLFTLSFSHPLTIDTELKAGQLYIKSQHEMKNYALMGSHVNRANITGDFSIDATYDLNISAYIDGGWQIKQLSTDIFSYEHNEKYNIMAKNIENKIISQIMDDKVDLSNETIGQGLTIKSIGLLENNLRTKLDIKTLSFTQKYEQIDKSFWQSKSSLCRVIEKGSFLDCLFLRVKENSIGKIKTEIIGKDILFNEEFTPSKAVAEMEELKASFYGIEKQGKISTTHHLNLSSLSYQRHTAGQEALLPQDLSYSVGIINLDKNTIKQAENFYHMNITQTPIVAELKMKTSEATGLDFIGKAVFSEETELTIMDILYATPYMLNNLGNSFVEGELVVTEQAKIVDILAPMLPIGKTMVNLFLNMYGQKTKDTPPKHFYKLTIEDGKPKVNGRGLGLKF